MSWSFSDVSHECVQLHSSPCLCQPIRIGIIPFCLAVMVSIDPSFFKYIFVFKAICGIETTIKHSQFDRLLSIRWVLRSSYSPSLRTFCFLIDWPQFIYEIHTWRWKTNQLTLEPFYLCSSSETHIDQRNIKTVNNQFVSLHGEDSPSRIGFNYNARGRWELLSNF